jgi:hypothetical protein
MILNTFLLPISLITNFNVSFPAYIGPGTGLSAIGAFLAVAAGITVAIIGFFWYPIKRLLGKSKKAQEPEPEFGEED